MNAKSKPGSLLIKGGHVIDPAAKINAPMDVLLRDGRVAEIALPNKIRGGADEKFDARGLIVAPGFIDLHVHLREPGQRLQRNDRHRHRRRGGRRFHLGLHHAEHRARGRHCRVGCVVAASRARRRSQCLPYRRRHSQLARCCAHRLRRSAARRSSRRYRRRQAHPG